MFNNKNTMIKTLITTLILGFAFMIPAKAQLAEIEAFLNAGSDNATALTRAYLKPLPTGLSASLNSGWTTKAAPTKTLGFSIQLRMAVAAVPSSGQSFDASTLGLTGITVSGASSSTISGDNSSGQVLNLPGGQTLTLPGGSGFEYVPTPMLQGNIGLIKGTDLTLRYIPEISNDDYGDISLFGAGIKHDLTQWIPGGKLLPVDITLMGAFTNIQMNANLEFNAGATDQRVETTTNTFVINALVGKSLPFISVYGGLGYQKGEFELDMLGNYDIGGGQTLSNPVSYTEESDAALHALAGFQFKLGPIRLFAEATAAEYTTFNGGIGIGLRN